MTADEQKFALISRELQLDNLQNLVLRACWQGQSYKKCAQAHDYAADSIKSVGYKLWRLLSLKLNKKVKKSNFKSILIQHFLTPTERQNWGEAVDTSELYRRSEELLTLERWLSWVCG